MTTFAPTHPDNGVFDQGTAVPSGLVSGDLRTDSQSAVPARRSGLNKRFTIALAGITSLLMFTTALAVVFHNDASSTHARLRSTHSKLTSTQSQLHTTEGTLHETQAKLDSSQAELVAAQQTISRDEQKLSENAKALEAGDQIIATVRQVGSELSGCVKANRVIFDEIGSILSGAFVANAASDATTADAMCNRALSDFNTVEQAFSQAGVTTNA